MLFEIFLQFMFYIIVEWNTCNGLPVHSFYRLNTNDTNDPFEILLKEVKLPVVFDFVVQGNGYAGLFAKLNNHDVFCSLVNRSSKQQTFRSVQIAAEASTLACLLDGSSNMTSLHSLNVSSLVNVSVVIKTGEPICLGNITLNDVHFEADDSCSTESQISRLNLSNQIILTAKSIHCGCDYALSFNAFDHKQRDADYLLLLKNVSNSSTTTIHPNTLFSPFSVPVPPLFVAKNITNVIVVTSSPQIPVVTNSSVTFDAANVTAKIIPLNTVTTLITTDKTAVTTTPATLFANTVSNSLTSTKDFFQTTNVVGRVALVTAATISNQINNSKAGILLDAPCSLNPCFNNGTCVTLGGNNFSCLCVPPHVGIFCEAIDEPCNKNGCVNGATCVADYKSQNYSCRCSPNYSGRFCEDVNLNRTTPSNESCETVRCDHGYVCKFNETAKAANCVSVDFCMENKPCQNGGFCEQFDNRSLSNQVYRCLCTPGFTGQDCESAVVGNCPCKNGGQCVTINDATRPSNLLIVSKKDVVCQCLDGWVGLMCEYVNQCFQQRPCLNDGICTSINDGNYSCQCSDGYSGMKCENSIPTVSLTSPTTSTSAAIVNAVDHVAVFLGATSTATIEHQSSGSKSSGHTAKIVGGVFGALLIIAVLLAVIVFVRFVRRSRKLKGKYNPAKEEVTSGQTTSQFPMTSLESRDERLI